mmetsp:Transcript_13851/g.42919  ORF Transcript_13851/g.42919 Transcript_13851/m.42919 type:complete len:322 (-) Transcript_13851:190-1155(-)
MRPGTARGGGLRSPGPRRRARAAVGRRAVRGDGRRSKSRLRRRPQGAVSGARGARGGPGRRRLGRRPARRVPFREAQAEAPARRRAAGSRRARRLLRGLALRVRRRRRRPRRGEIETAPEVPRKRRGEVPVAPRPLPELPDRRHRGGRGRTRGRRGGAGPGVGAPRSRALGGPRPRAGSSARTLEIAPKCRRDCSGAPTPRAKSLDRWVPRRPFRSAPRGRGSRVLLRPLARRAGPRVVRPEGGGRARRGTRQRARGVCRRRRRRDRGRENAVGHAPRLGGRDRRARGRRGRGRDRGELGAFRALSWEAAARARPGSNRPS